MIPPGGAAYFPACSKLLRRDPSRPSFAPFRKGVTVLAQLADFSPLVDFSSAVLLVSHDRYFVDALATEKLELKARATTMNL